LIASSAAAPTSRFPHVVLTIDNRPWHWDEPIRHPLRGHPNVELYRLPRYGPQLNAVEQFWKLPRRSSSPTTPPRSAANPPRSDGAVPERLS